MTDSASPARTGGTDTPPASVPWGPGVVVILITAFSSIATTGAAAEAGIRCSLLKPVNFSVLMPLVDEVVNGRVSNNPVEIGSAIA